jgi:hypothetical protein
MRVFSVIAYVSLGIVWACQAGMSPGDVGAPEVKGALRCEIRLATNTAAWCSRLSVFGIVHNTSTLEAQLPAPYSSEVGMKVTLYLLAERATGSVERLLLPFAVLSSSPSAKEWEILRERRSEHWHLLLQSPPASWISIPAHGKAEFLIYAEMSPRTEEGSVRTPAPGTYGLECNIEYSMGNITSAAFFQTNQWTSATDIAKARASGVFLLDMHRLWTGKMESNIVPITLTGSAK